MTRTPTIKSLLLISLKPFVRNIHHWWLRRLEAHYLMCADVEQERVREHQRNLAYYQKKAALARANRL